MIAETAVKASMGGLLMATVPVGGDISQWGQWGLAGLVVGYTLWRDWQREKCLTDAIEKHQAWVRDQLIRALERNTQALEKLNQKKCMRDVA
jgi:hypothetical protein